MKQFSIHSLAPDLIDHKGHLYPYHMSLKEAVEKLELKHSAWVSSECKIAPLPIGWQKFFSFKDPLQLSYSTLIGRFKNYCSLFKQSESSLRIFFHDSFNTSELVILAAAFFLYQKKQESLFLLFRYTPAQLRFQGNLHRWICVLLKWRFKQRLVLLTDSALIAQEWAEKAHLSLRLVPIPHTQEGSSLPLRKLSSPLFCWWPGEPRASKGRALIAHLLTLKDPAMKAFHLHVSVEARLTSTTLSLTELAKALSREDYFQLFQQCPVILLPYDPAVYAGSTSGIFVEAICAGCMPLVREGTWMAHELKKHALTECIVDWQDPLFFTGVLRLLQNPSLLSRLNLMRSHYLDFHSSSSMAEHLKEILQDL